MNESHKAHNKLSMNDSSNAGQIAQAGRDINQIQGIDAVQGQIIAQMMGGLAVGQLTVYLSQTPTEVEAKSATAPAALGQNPYQGLKAFRETDGDRFFGRELQIEALRERFQRLHDDRSTMRVLPIYGPSGSGKSSLARAGLIPALGKHPLPGRDRGRVVVLTPGNHPLEALATVLARIATHDPTPVTKTREFKEELLQPNNQPNHQPEEFDGLRRIADVFPDIAVSPLILLVDQFEELYTLCDDEQERHAFVENLLCAASDRAQHVSVILTMRSDWLGATQQHPHLNQLFSSQGFLVPIMQPEELEIAITEPAKQAGYTIDKATVRLLVEESQEHEAALPLLQFALTQIWEGLRAGVAPADTLEHIGGVGGALASEAKRLYGSLTPEQQKIARCIFLALIQLNEDNKITRRRAPLSELITSEQDAPLVRAVIDRFAQPGVWILITSTNEQQVEMLEVAHEALIRSWGELQEWLKEHWQALRQKRKLEQAASEWKDHQKSKDYLLQGRSLRDAREFLQAHKDNTETAPSSLAKDFVRAGIKKQRISILKFASVFLVFPLIGTLIAVHLQIIARANSILSRDDCKPDPEIKGFLEYMWWTRYADRLRDLKLCHEDLRGIKLPRSIIEYSDCRKANLSNSDFRGAIVSKSDFREATLEFADFQCLEGKCTILIGINFQKANLTGANFQNSFLKNTDFRGANLERAKLDGTKFLTIEQLEGAKLCHTTIPNNLSISGNRDCPIGQY